MSNNNFNHIKILFIDSSNLFNSLSAEIKEASNKKEAYTIMQNFSPDIIITDIEMPSVAGVDFIKPKNFEMLFKIQNKNHPSSFLPKGYSYDWNKKTLLYQYKEIKLTKKEILFSEILFKNRRRIVTYSELENHVWKESVMTEYSIRSLVKNLRKKLPHNLIENLSGVGYRLTLNS